MNQDYSTRIPDALGHLREQIIRSFLKKKNLVVNERLIQKQRTPDVRLEHALKEILAEARPGRTSSGGIQRHGTLASKIRRSNAEPKTELVDSLRLWPWRSAFAASLIAITISVLVGEKFFEGYLESSSSVLPSLLAVLGCMATFFCWRLLRLSGRNGWLALVLVPIVFLPFTLSLDAPSSYFAVFGPFCVIGLLLSMVRRK